MAAEAQSVHVIVARLDQLPRGQREQILAASSSCTITSSVRSWAPNYSETVGRVSLPGAADDDHPQCQHSHAQIAARRSNTHLPHLAQLPTTARSFLENNLFAPKEREYVQTRKQVLRRLYDILSNPTFERMLPRNALDMKRVLDDGKIVLVNTAKTS